MSEQHPPRELSDAEAAELCEKLEALIEDRSRIAALAPELRRRLLTAAGRFSRPVRDEAKTLTKAFRKRRREALVAADEAILDRTGIRTSRRAPVYPTPSPALGGPRPFAHLPSSSSSSSPSSPDDPPRVRDARKCYVCKAPFHELHAFYDQMCPPCAAFNWDKRHQTADLRGRTALITGARVKIGYQASIMLLRAGARVLVTTRFPHDAARRYATEPDFADFGPRLRVFGLDLRHTPSVELFARHVAATEPRLDFILHNACQTVRRPPGFYAHLMEAERAPLEALPPAERELVGDFHALRVDPTLEGARGLLSAPELSQAAHTAEDRLLEGARLALFPAGQLDQDLQQVDLRDRNSWRLKLGEVPTVELLEVQLVNAVAPFVLTNALRPLMTRDGRRDKHVVNVSAMEGQFYRAHKTDKHPHTNMAKAALNMLTRTSAADLVQDGIHMNSVDTGWVTDEDPLSISARKVEEHGFSPPLDIVDGAARICDPIFVGVNTGEHPFGQFLKDYKPVPW